MKILWVKCIKWVNPNIKSPMKNLIKFIHSLYLMLLNVVNVLTKIKKYNNI